ncbi:MAG: isoleucine--tRNA ligase [Phycisphaerae bacterium]|nr:isoleucine--tRNA ligase [Phycisphaerae bacterium]
MLEKKNYKSTLNLPQTSFPMEAKLVASEPPRLARWKESRLYEKIITSRAARPKWILHDGPPFANGDIHLGHLINKTLKDVLIRCKTMANFQTPYVPGWDCHGLPIEHKIQQELGPKLREMSTVEVRQRCHAYAEKYVGVQREQFQRLGILGDWHNPYLTMKPEYEAATLEVFAKFVEAGLVYKQLKPVPWSIANQTALADAELEYQDVDDQSVFVEFPGTEDNDTDGTHYLVWTTTPWTLPANLAIAIHPQVEYAYVRYRRGDHWRMGVIASALVDRVLKNRDGISDVEINRVVQGERLLGQTYRHPFIERTGKLVAAEYVTTEDGTGLVHTAPGHGEDDYETGVREKLDVYSPVLANGRFDETVPSFLHGKTTKEGNGLIVEELKKRNSLLAEEKIRHSYPHDWRSKTPIIFRATEQWFVAMDKPVDGKETLRQRAEKAVDSQIEFVPGWGKHRIAGMLASRPDWCISRQRAWGLPIPVFYNGAGKPLLTPESVRAVAKHVRMYGSDAWFTEEPSELLGSDFVYPPGFSADDLRKEKDIFDVWFESGSSWHAVLQGRSYLHFPADMYLEGSDQHRGWFQLSLLPGLGAAGLPPFKQVLTHGFVVKPDGTKVSKSDKEYVTAMQEVDRHGADLLRLWCCSMDYQGDMPASPQAIKEFGDKYRKIRNTLRYLLSNLFDFDPVKNSREIPADSLDGWIAAELDTLIVEVRAAYDAYQLHRAFRLLHDFCSVQISAIYGNAMKDRLYCDAPDSALRRRAQTIMHRIVVALTKLLAPMIVYTADETWDHISHKPATDRNLDSVHLALFPESFSAPRSELWPMLMKLRESALTQLDELKKSAGMNKALDAELVYQVDAATLKKLEPFGVDLEDIVSAGFHSFAQGNGEPRVTVIDRRDDYSACARSWKRRPDVGSDPNFPELSARDAAAVI